jgi:flagellar biosynthetic protein FliR
MGAVHVDLRGLGVFLSIFLRLAVVLFMLPFFNTKQFPARVKAPVVLCLAAMLYPILRTTVAPLPFEPGGLVVVIFGEIIFGMVLAFSILVVLAAVQFAGDLISFQMGFSFAQSVDPATGGQEPVISRWIQMITMMLFLSLNGHHVLLRALVDSFRNIPIGGFVLDAVHFNKLMALVGQLFVIGIQIAAPVMVLLLMIHLILALVGKFAPQINLMATSFPITITLGMLSFILALPIIKEAIGHRLIALFHVLHTLIE